MAETTDGHGALKGIRVVELSHMIMGPSCGMFLAFLGADVIKVEPPGGDKTRDLTGMGRGFFPTFNRGKRSVQLDLKAPEGRRALEALLATADVLVENFRDSSLEAMGLAPGQLRERYPDLIVVSCKGFLEGPYETRPALDEVVQMMTGMAHMTGPTGRPLRIGSSANDIMAGLFGAFAVLAELLKAERFGGEKEGRGAAIRVGLFENCLLLVAQHMVQFAVEGTEAPPMPERAFSWAVYDIFKTRDNRQVFVGAVTENQWRTLCRLLDLPALLNDPSLQTRMEQIEARARTIPVVGEAIAERDFADVVGALQDAGLPFSPIARPVEMYDDPQANYPGRMPTTMMDDGESFTAPALPYEVNGEKVTPSRVDLPGIGADTDAVLDSLQIPAEDKLAASGKTKAPAQ